MQYNDEYLTPREVMDLFCIGRNSIYKLLNSGELQAFRVGRSWRISLDSVERYVRMH